MPLVPAHRRQRQDFYEFEANLDYTVSSRAVRTKYGVLV